MTIYTVIGYREDYYDSRYEDKSGSDFEIFFTENKEEAINKIFEFRIRSKIDPEYYKYLDWETSLLINGQDDSFWIEDQNEPNPLFWEIEATVRKMLDEWHSKTKEREELAKKEAEEKKKRDQEASAKRVIVAEKKLLSELKGKYPNG